MAFDYLFNGAPPQDVTSTIGSQTNLPDWYAELVRGIASKGTQIAGRGYTPYPGQRLAGFTPDQQSAFQGVRNLQGAWQPGVTGALGAVNQALPTASAFLDEGANYGQGAVNAVAGPAQTWTGNWQQYMSPYTQGVVNEIGRLGNQNLNENVLHGINDSFIGNGGFGSDRNADMIGRGIRDAQTNISGLQAQALEQGYGTSAGIFGQDAGRQQQQQALQANTDVQAGQLSNAGAQIGAAAADTTGQQMGALTQLGQQLGYQDASGLGTIGSAQQGLQQQGYDTGYNEFQNQQNWDWGQLNNVNSLLRGMQLPASQTQVANTPYGNVGTSPLQWATSLYGLANTGRPATTTGP